MIRLTYTHTREIEVDPSCPDHSEVLVDSLKSIGFRNITVNDNWIEFKCDPSDPILESFQRRYGNGKILFKSAEKLIFITVITDNKRSFKISLITSVALIGLLICFWTSSNKPISDLFLFGGAFIISFILGHFIESSIIKHEQHKLLDLISENMNSNLP